MKLVDDNKELLAQNALVMLGWEWEAFEEHLQKCDAETMQRVLELLEPDTGNEYYEMLSRAARIEINKRLDS